MTICICQVSPTTEVTVPDYASLVSWWRSAPWDARMLVGSFIVEKPPTRRQINRLHRDLRAKLRPATLVAL
jgi:hypothetical protein